MEVAWSWQLRFYKQKSPSGLKLLEADGLGSGFADFNYNITIFQRQTLRRSKPRQQDQGHNQLACKIER